MKMSSENTNLEEMVEKTLESTGILPKLRAELRANVYQVIEKGSSFQNKLYSEKLKDFLSDKNGPLLLSLVEDLLVYLELKYTTSVFNSESTAGSHYQYQNKDDMCRDLFLSQNDKRPLLLQILETYQSFTKSTTDDTKQNGETCKESTLDQVLTSNIGSSKTIFDIKSKSLSPIKTEFSKEQNLKFNNHANSESLSSSNDLQLRETESSDSLNSSGIEQLSPIKIPTEQNDNTDEDIKFDLQSNKNDSSLEDIETDENVSCGNDSLASTDISTHGGSLEIIKTHNLHL